MPMLTDIELSATAPRPATLIAGTTARSLSQRRTTIADRRSIAALRPRHLLREALL